jgi:hypothetical protein
VYSTKYIPQNKFTQNKMDVINLYQPMEIAP